MLHTNDDIVALAERFDLNMHTAGQLFYETEKFLETRAKQLQGLGDEPIAKPYL